MALSWISSTKKKAWKQERKPGLGSMAPTLALGVEEGHAWQGFGGCFNEIGWEVLQSLPAEVRARLLDALFTPAGDCRFNYCRLPIGANDYALEWYSHNEHVDDFKMEKFSIARDEQYLLPYIREAQERCPELELFASPWCPPTWFKKPRAYNFGTMIWEPRYLKAYALYFLKFVEAYGQAGVKVKAVHIQNEPNSDQKFPSCKWTGAQMRDFIRDYIGPLFKREKVGCEIWAGTIEKREFNAWSFCILSDAKTRQYVTGVGFQWEGKACVQRTHQSWPEVPIIQTENECGDGSNTWDYAMYVFDLMHHYITNGASAYVYWNMLLPPGGRSTWGWLQNAMITIDPATGKVTYNPEFYVMKHLSHFVQRGAHRLVVSGMWASNTLAFRNPDGQTVVAVRNPSAQEDTLCLEICGKPQSFTLQPDSINTITW